MPENINISWTHWFILIGIFVGAYLLIGFLINLIDRNTLKGSLPSRIIHYLRISRIVLEPLGLGIILMTFALINPYVHGPLILVSLALAYLPLKNYITGRLLLLDSTFTKGERISVQGAEGVINDVDRLGLTLQIKEGVRFINYSTLITEGFTKVAGKRLEGINFLQITPSEEMEDQTLFTLKNKLFACPYVDWFYHPEITVMKQPNQQVAYKARLRVRQDQHLQYLINLIKEWGYDCRAII